MSRYPTRKRFYCHTCKRYTLHTRPAGEPVGELVYTCTAYGCGGMVKVQGARKEKEQDRE